MTLICIGDDFGQLGNRLLRAAHVLAFCRENGFGFLDLPFAPYAQCLATSARALALSFPRIPLPRRVASAVHIRVGARLRNAGHRIGRVRRLRPLLSRTVHHVSLEHGKTLDLTGREVAESFRQYRLVVLSGWEFRGHSLVREHNDWLRDRLRLNASPADPTIEAVAAAKAAGKTVVGVHIRAGDYRTWRDGKYFYLPESYAERMGQLVRDLAPKPVTFLVCSNEPVPAESFGEFEWFAASGDVVSDMASLSACDLVFGPPSSFSLWAAFVGNTKLLHLAPDHPFAVDRFRVPADLRWVLEP